MEINEIIIRYRKENPYLSQRALAKKIDEENNFDDISETGLRRRIRILEASEKMAKQILLPNTKDLPKITSLRENKTLDESENSKTYAYTGEKSITSLDEAIEFFEIDMENWEVERFKCNSWDVTGAEFGKRTNYQVTVWLKRKEEELDWDSVKEKLDKAIEKTPIKIVKGERGVGVVSLADFHVGAKVKGLNITKDFDYEILVERMRKVASLVNEMKFKEVHLNFLGDFIETFTGLNHPNSWKSISYFGYGMKAVIMCHLMFKEFISSINNVVVVNLVSGNHDRVTSNKAEDQQGQVGEMLHYLLTNDFEDIKVNWNPIVVNHDIDGIRYILTHGHHPMSKKDMTTMFWNYGDQKKYNIMLSGHIHTRGSRKVYNKEETYIDQMNFRGISLPPIFTGNYYSESLGLTSTAGFLIIENNGEGFPNVYDYTV